ncbi:MAG: hypothetical protein ABWZ53_10930 [Actinomycetota bacterium]
MIAPHPSAITITIDHSAIATTAPVSWAVGLLRDAFARQQVATRVVLDDDPSGPAVNVAGGDRSPAAQRIARTGTAIPHGDEAFVVSPDPGDDDLTLIWGSGVRGLVYGVLELADRLDHATQGAPARPRSPIVGRPSNEVRSVARLFCSEVEDLGWFRDEGFWDRYLSMLVGQRFNRFSLTLGLGYNYHRGITDAYLYFAYPFLVSVPGSDVRVPQLPDEERDRNLSMLRHISDACAARGLDFQLGLWTHAYDWIDSPEARHAIEGLTPERHAAYCRDALTVMLEACPSVGGVTFRIHGESGIPERSWDFWRTVFSGVAACGRRVGIDLHAKGLDERTLQDALDTGLPVTVSPKFWAEHMGPPYHQAAIREHERPVREDPSSRSEWHRHMAVSEGSRPFTRYGYADFLREDRSYAVVFRLWAGTQRVLLWGDPATAAGYGRAAALAGSQGLEWCEPLTFKGREGTGTPGSSRTGYADPSLEPADDWEKYAYTYRLLGRLTYDPATPPEQWQRSLECTFGAMAPAAEAALASASRILPLVTVAHHPSASNNYYWPELYTDMPIVWSEDGTRPHPYLDTPQPRRFGTASPLDPEVFSDVAGFVAELLAGEPDGRMSPLQVADRLQALAMSASRRIGRIEENLRDHEAGARRWLVDVRILAALGRFFAAKLRAAVWYELYVGTGDPEALRLAVEQLTRGRDAWLDASERAGVYVRDLTYGPELRLRGHWADRLPAIDADLRDMRDRVGAAVTRPARSDIVRRVTAAARPVDVAHQPTDAFVPGTPLGLRVEVCGEGADRVAGIRVRYRPMNQALEVQSREMDRTDGGFETELPGAELTGEYPLAYAFEIRDRDGMAWRHPGLGRTLSERPYVVIRPRRERSSDGPC